MKQNNIVAKSGVLWLKKWVKVKYVSSEEELPEGEEKDKGTLELAHAIILEQMNQKV